MEVQELILSMTGKIEALIVKVDNLTKVVEGQQKDFIAHRDQDFKELRIRVDKHETNWAIVKSWGAISILISIAIGVISLLNSLNVI